MLHFDKQLISTDDYERPVLETCLHIEAGKINTNSTNRWNDKISLYKQTEQI